MKLLRRTLLATVLGAFLVMPACRTVQKPPPVKVPLEQVIDPSTMENLPFFPQTMIINGDENFSVEAVNEALYTFLETYLMTFQPEELEDVQAVFDALNNCTIIFMDDNWKIKGMGFDELGNPVGDRPQEFMIRGLTVNRGLIMVSKKEGAVSQSSLTHELIHLLIWNLTGDGDADHLGDKYPGWTPKHTEIKDLINSTLAIKGF